MKINNCKEITEAFVFCNKLIINALQYRYFCVLKVPVLHGKSAYITMQLILENKEKSKFVQTD